MKKQNSLYLGLMALTAISPLAQAVHLNAGGLGEVLLYPYYTVNGGNQTLLSVVNTTDQGKAIKVRFREGMNSRQVLGFNLYLSPFDVWTAAVFSLSDASDAPANLLTFDDSCTVPRIKGNIHLPDLSPWGGEARYVPFYAFGYTEPGYPGNSNDSGPDSPGRTREGHFEVIEMGEVVNRENTSLTAISPDYDGYPHDGIPNDCWKIQYAWIDSNDALLDNYWITNSLIDMNPPGGGLYGSAMIVDVLNGTMLSYQAEALDDFSSIVQHTGPGELQPDLGSAVSDAAEGVAHALVFDKGSPVTLSYPVATQAVDAVSAVIMVDNLYNDFWISPDLGAQSEWVVTFPTKSFYTDLPAGSTAAIPPFTHLFPREGTQGTAPVLIKLALWNRKGSMNLGSDFLWWATTNFPPSEWKLDWASNVLRFDGDNPDRTPILGSGLWFDVEAMEMTEVISEREGHMQLCFYGQCFKEYEYVDSLNPHQLRPDLQGRRLRGLPAIGFWAVSITNGDLGGGILSNYSGVVKHQYTQSLAPTLDAGQ